MIDAEYSVYYVCSVANETSGSSLHAASEQIEEEAGLKHTPLHQPQTKLPLDLFREKTNSKTRS